MVKVKNNGKSLISLKGRHLEQKPVFSLKRKQPGKRLAPNSKKSLLDILKSTYTKRVVSGVLAVSLFSGIALIESSSSLVSASKEDTIRQTQIEDFIFEEPSKEVNTILDSKPVIESIKFRLQSSRQPEPYDFSFYNNVEAIVASIPLIIKNSEVIMKMNDVSKEEAKKVKEREEPANLEPNTDTDLSLEEPAPITEEQSLEMMRNEILKTYNLTDEQFDIICAVVLAEAWVNSYEDAYAVINTIFNRTRSYAWHYSVDKDFGEGAGFSLYYQVILAGQFSVYSNGEYKKFLGVRDLPGYKAVLDFLTTQEPMHDYLNFYANFGDTAGKEQFVPNGNLYYNHLQPEDIIPIEEEMTPEEEDIHSQEKASTL